VLAEAGSAESFPFHVVGAELPGLLPHFCHDLPSRVEPAIGRIREAYGLLCDDLSQETFVREVAWRVGSRSAAERAPVPDQYFPAGLYSARDDDVFIDCGAFDGHTLRVFLMRRVDSLWYRAYEPDPANRDELRRYVEALVEPTRSKVTIRDVATFDSPGEVRFSQAGDGSSVSDSGTLVVQTVRLDDEPISPPATFIKADVEGAERATMLGAERVIREARPVPAVCVYHRPEDLWELPILARAMCPDYAFFLRMHAQDGCETVLYAVPAERAVRSPRR
jgi:FkbM family methyltransferase